MVSFFKYNTILLILLVFSNADSQDKTIDIVSPGLIFNLLTLNGDLPTAAKPKFRSPSAFASSKDGSLIFVAEQTAKQVTVVNLTKNAIEKTIRLPNEVTGIAALSDGSKVFATCASRIWPSGIVCEIDIKTGAISRKIPAGHTARSPVLSPDEKTLYVCNLFDNDISVIDLSSGRETKRIAVIREPMSAGITPDGSILVVGNSLPNEKSTDSLNVTCKISLINTQTATVIKHIPLPIGSHSVMGITISPDGKYAFATHLIAMFNLPATLLEGGWIHTNNVAVIDIVNNKLLNDMALDHVSLGAANPWGVDCTKDGKFLCIAHSGSNELSIIDLPVMLDSAKKAIDFSHNLKVLYPNTIRKRVNVEGKAPRALIISGNKVVTAGYFGDSLEIFDISLSTKKASGFIPLGHHIPMNGEREGEFRFYDGSLCIQTWQSCNSCHPFGRPDALNWILQGGNNTPKNAKSMLYSWYTPPTAWAGRRKNASESIRAGIKAELFRDVDEKLAVVLDTFFIHMKPVPSPHLVKGRLSDAAQKGRDIYYSDRIDCKECHPAPLFTNNKPEMAGVKDPFDANSEYITPHLIETWRTGPYDHIGSHDKLEDLLRLKSHTNAGSLNETDFNNLLKYVLSL